MSDQDPMNDDTWRDKLTPEQFHVAREKGTERAFTGAYWDKKDPGRYRCVCCGADLFHSSTKYDSGSGWPSFTEPSDDARIAYESDSSSFMRRVEVMCKACNCHLGHVFDDGPGPSGKRYCINSASLDFEPEDDT